MIWALAAAGGVLAACAGESRTPASPTESTVAACTDKADNDSDGFIDCADQDCFKLVVCAGAGGGDATTPGPEPDGGSPDVHPAPDVTATPEDTGAAVQDEGPALDLAEPPPSTFTCTPCGYGSLTGKVCAPNEQVFVNEATVTIEATNCAGETVVLTATSDANGVYHFDEVPCGKHVVDVEKGSFHTDYPVNIATGEHTDLTGAATKLCFQATSTKIAVLTGNYDDIEGLLDQLGLAYHLYSTDGAVGDGDIVGLLSEPAKLAQYQIVFANCGGFHGWMPQDYPEVMPNVKDYILNGGSFYMSDYAWVYGEWAFPDAIEFMGEDDPGQMYKDGSPQLIGSGLSVLATVADGSLGAYLGKTSLVVHFDQGPQIAPEVAGSGTIPHVSAKITQLSPWIDATLPLVLSYKPTPTSGRVIYTNFHNDAQTTGDMLKVLNYLVFTL